MIYISVCCAGDRAIFIYFLLQKDLLYYYYCPITLKQKLVQERSYKKRSNLTEYQIKQMAIHLFVYMGHMLSGQYCKVPALHSVPPVYLYGPCAG